MIPELVMSAVVLTVQPATAGTVVPAAVVQSAARLPGRWSRFAACVAQRESHNNYKARNRGSSASGRWQFLDRAWRKSLAYMVRDRLIDHGMEKAHANSIQRRLAKTPIHLWAPWAQDAGFAAVVTAKDGKGWRHWANGGRCDRLAVAR